MRLPLTIVRRLAAVAATAVLGGLLTATLVRTSPGFDVDERQLDSRLTSESRALLVDEHAGDRDVARFYFRHITAMLHGDLGSSPSLNRPIAELIVDRLPVTLGLMASGVAGGWLLAFGCALPAVTIRQRACGRIADLLSVVALCVPSAAMAVLLFAIGGPVHAIVAVVLFPRIFEYLRNLLREAYQQPHVVTARAKGLAPSRILFRHVMPACGPELLALAGISVTMAFGIAIPVETLCDLPGIGQLAWKAAVARDLPVLVTLTMLIAMLTQASNGLSDWTASGMRGSHA